MVKVCEKKLETRKRRVKRGRQIVKSIVSVSEMIDLVVWEILKEGKMDAFLVHRRKKEDFGYEW